MRNLKKITIYYFFSTEVFFSTLDVSEQNQVIITKGLMKTYEIMCGAAYIKHNSDIFQKSISTHIHFPIVLFL